MFRKTRFDKDLSRFKMALKYNLSKHYRNHPDKSQ